MTTASPVSKASATSVTTASSSSGRKEATPAASSVLAEVGVAIGNGLRRASLEDILAADARGELYHNPDAPEGPDLPDSFWENAVVVEPPKTRSVHLKIDAEVFHHFLAETGGKGHITRMQAVLKSYVKAQKAAAAKRLAKG